MMKAADGGVASGNYWHDDVTPFSHSVQLSEQRVERMVFINRTRRDSEHGNTDANTE